MKNPNVSSNLKSNKVGTLPVIPGSDENGAALSTVHLLALLRYLLHLIVL